MDTQLEYPDLYGIDRSFRQYLVHAPSKPASSPSGASVYVSLCIHWKFHSYVQNEDITVKITEMDI